MRGLGIAWRVLLLAGIFAVVGILTDHALIHHAVARGASTYEVRLAGMMAGLFCGGIAALAAGIALLLMGKPKSAR